MIYGADLSSKLTAAQWEVLKSKRAVTFGVARCYEGSGRVDPKADANLKAMASAGIERREVYHFPCCRVGVAQFDSTATGNGVYWLDIETGDWPPSKAQCVDLIHAYVAAVESRVPRVGIYTSLYEWSLITGDSSEFADLPLWYAHYDCRASFDDFRAAGPRGWKAPVRKQFCGNRKFAGCTYDGNVEL